VSYSFESFPAFDKQLTQFGCQTFSEFFDAHPHAVNNFDQFAEMQMTDDVTVSEALRLHTSRVLAVAEDLAANCEEPEKMRDILRELGRQHARQVIERI